MRAGDLRRRIAIQRRVVTKDSFGQQQQSWIDLLPSVPAEITALSGRELLAAQAVNGETTHQITVRYHPRLANPTEVAGMRAVYAAGNGVQRYFNLLASMNVDERNRQIVIQASEGLHQQ